MEYRQILYVTYRETRQTTPSPQQREDLGPPRLLALPSKEETAEMAEFLKENDSLYNKSRDLWKNTQARACLWDQQGQVKAWTVKEESTEEWVWSWGPYWCQQVPAAAFQLPDPYMGAGASADDIVQNFEGLHGTIESGAIFNLPVHQSFNSDH